MGDGAAEGGLAAAATRPADAAQAAFARGDFRDARRLAQKLLDDDSADEPARASARTILERTGIDPFVGWLSAACLAFFVLVIVLALR